MKYATQIHRNESCWRPGIYPKKTKREAVAFRDGINKTGGDACLLKKNSNPPYDWISIN